MRPHQTSRLSALVPAVLLLAGCCTSCSKSPWQYLQSGNRYFQFGKYREAAIQLQNAVHGDPKLAEAHYQLARTYLALKSPQGALQELRETVALDPKNSDAQLQLAGLLIAERQYAEAKAIVKTVLSTKPKSARAHELLGDQSALTGDMKGDVHNSKPRSG